MFYGFDPLQMTIAVGGMLLSLIASGYVRHQFMRGKELPLSSGRTGEQVARAILRDNDIQGVEVVEHQGFLSDHYNPATRTLALSPDVFNGRNAAAAGVAAHEVGHALQHAQGSLSMWGRTILVYPAHFGAMFAPWLVIAGLFMAGFKTLVPGTPAHAIAVAGVFLFGIALLCSLVIVVNEFNASARARVALVRLGITRGGEEDAMVRRVLTAAGLTYVAGAVIAASQFAYWAYVAFGQQREE